MTMLDKIRNEPAVVVGLVVAVLTLVVTFGIPISADQKAAIVGVVGAVLSLLGAGVTRSQVSPAARRDTKGRFKGEGGFLALDMTPRQWDWDLIVWPLWLGAFVVLELLGIFHKVPWSSLSRFAWKLESFSPVLPYVFLIGLAVLLVHIVTGFPGHRPW